MRRWWERFVLVGAMFFAHSCGRAQDDVGIYTDPASAGSEYQIQGEYLGQLHAHRGDETWGGQALALGRGTFRLILFSGGLPGQGWKRGDEQISADSTSSEEAITFHLDRWGATIQRGTITVIAKDGSLVGTLQKIERKSPTLGAKAPAGATVLFDGTSASKFKHGRIVMKDLLAADCTSREEFGDHSLHLEFRTPFKPEATGQARGNSGVYVQNRYEIQILDSFGLEGKHDECGGIYSIAAPLVNMCLPPLRWQTYDIDFTAARYDRDGKKLQNARITVHHNGVVIHRDLELTHGTPGRAPEGPKPDALYLQGHGDPVVFRNIWVMPKNQ